MYVGFSTRTLERRFRQQFRTTPKVWITHERMRLAPPLLAEGFSNKEVAASLTTLVNQISAAISNDALATRPKSSGVFKRQQSCSCRVL